MFAPRRQESSGQLCAPQYPALGFGEGKCSIIRSGGGRECGIFCLSFLGITKSPSIHLQTGGSEMTDIQISVSADNAKLGCRTNDK